MISYGCVILNINVLPNQYFLNFFILSLIEIPGNITGWLGTDFLGRRTTGVITFLMAAIISLVGALQTESKYKFQVKLKT